jgi:hypothetical protein
MEPGPQLSADEKRRITAEFERRRLWRRACAFDGIDPSTSFVVFTENNPYAGLLDEYGVRQRPDDAS